MGEVHESAGFSDFVPGNKRFYTSTLKLIWDLWSLFLVKSNLFFVFQILP